MTIATPGYRAAARAGRRHLHRHLLVGAVLVAASAGVGCTVEVREQPPPSSAPSLPNNLATGWSEFLPGGESICSRGTEYAYFVRKGNINKVVIDFIGGGACWNQQTCSVADAIFNPDVENVRAAIDAGIPFGFYDDTRQDNPFRDWYHVVIPYCTGDIHWGNNVKTYGSGADAFDIHHKGAVNTRAVLAWVYANFSAPEQIFVTGCSAGSYGSIMWAPHIAEHYPNSSVVQFGDSGAGIITKSFFADSFPAWKAEGAFPTWIDGLDPNKTDVLELHLGDLYAGLVNYYPQHKFSQYNTAFDENQAFYFKAMGGGDAQEWSKQMYASIADIKQHAPRFSSYIPSGQQHCILPENNFYTVNVGGRLLVDWLDDLLNGKSVEDLACSDCSVPTP